ncbi:hypothetical protein BE221DRAFT_113048 [Ostreococcus tauri]|uniref:LysM domain-containing protein n=1 Tax=Ostreococcus tauri TaxID=70448 RepID=A0A1Y5ICD8_OSTTA|nr:hypothetical protein BE221DRAFT_113048 [Ostreococcus tauri]
MPESSGASDRGRGRSRSPSPGPADRAFVKVKVARDETLREFAKRTNTRAEVILLLNPHANASALTAGMVLDVPAKAPREKESSGKTSTGRARDQSENSVWHSFSGQLYEKSYPTLDRTSKELTAEVKRKVKEFGDVVSGDRVVPLAGDLVGKSRERLSAWRLKMMSVIVSTTEDAAENIQGRSRKATDTEKNASAGKKKISVEKEHKAKAVAAAREKEQKEKAAAREKEQKEKAAAREKEQKAKAAAAREKAREKERQDKVTATAAREKEKNDKVTAAAAATAAAVAAARKQEKKDKAAAKSNKSNGVLADETHKELAWTLFFTAALGVLGHGLKLIGEKYHIGEGEGEGVKEWHPKMILEWMRTRLVFTKCRGASVCLTVRDKDADPDAPMKPMSKVGLTRNYFYSTNFAEQAKPVEKALVKRVEKTKAQVQSFVEGMKIRRIDELTRVYFALDEQLARGEFEKAQGLLTIWVDQSVNETYEKNLKRKVLAAWVELLSERYNRLRVMSKVYVRWQHIELSQAFNQWYENAHEAKVARYRKEGMQLQEKLKLERQRMENKRVTREESKMKWAIDSADMNEVKRSAFEERLAAAAADSKMSGDA